LTTPHWVKPQAALFSHWMTVSTHEVTGIEPQGFEQSLADPPYVFHLVVRIGDFAPDQLYCVRRI
jgi:hypothetical protein